MWKFMLCCGMVLAAACQPLSGVQNVAPSVQGFPPQRDAVPAAADTGAAPLPQGLGLHVLRAGSGAFPTINDEVEIRFRSYDAGGRLNEGTFNDVPVILPVADMFPGLQQGLMRMQAGGRYELHIPAHLGYREEGSLRPQAATYHIDMLRIVR